MKLMLYHKILIHIHMSNRGSCISQIYLINTVIFYRLAQCNLDIMKPVFNVHSMMSGHPVIRGRLSEHWYIFPILMKL